MKFRIFLTCNTPWTPVSFHKKFQPNRSSRLAGYPQHIYIYECLVYIEINNGASRVFSLSSKYSYFLKFSTCIYQLTNDDLSRNDYGSPIPLPYLNQRIVHNNGASSICVLRPFRSLFVMKFLFKNCKPFAIIHLFNYLSVFYDSNSTIESFILYFLILSLLQTLLLHEYFYCQC